MTSSIYFVLMVVGLPLVILAIALFAGFLHREVDERVDWQPTRLPGREVDLDVGDTHQMLLALNRYRRLRGVPERSLEEITERSGMDRE